MACRGDCLQLVLGLGASMACGIGSAEQQPPCRAGAHAGACGAGCFSLQAQPQSLYSSLESRGPVPDKHSYRRVLRCQAARRTTLLTSYLLYCMYSQHDNHLQHCIDTQIQHLYPATPCNT